jgi:hypothetical protein
MTKLNAVIPDIFYYRKKLKLQMDTINNDH